MFRETSTALVATLLFAIGVTALISNAAAKSPATCGSFYTVASGDTLFRIADEAYSDGRLYKKIYEANRDLLPNMQSVEIGDQILIPCLDGSGPATRSAAMAPTIEAIEAVEPIAIAELAGAVAEGEPFGVVAPIEATESVESTRSILVAGPMVVTERFEVIEATDITNRQDSPEPEAVAATKRMRILSGAGFAPYAGKLLPAGGMVTDLITRGVKNVAPDQDLRVSFINDWEAHLGTLLPDDSYDVSFPWIKPDCANAATLNEMTRSLCANFEFSNPFFEVPVSYYTRTGDSLVAIEDPAQLGAKRVCRPEAQFEFGPVQASLATPDAVVEIQQTAASCLTRLLAGEVDVVTLVKSDAEAELRKLSDAGQITEIEGLATTLTLHAIVAKSSPNGQANLAIINQGLASLMASGEWFEVVVRHRSERLARLD